MSKQGGKNKGGGGLRVFWIPTGKHKHHKRNKYYGRDNYNSPRSAMMSGDSPNSHSTDYVDFKEDRSTPPPTTSKEIVIQSSSGGPDVRTDVVTASALAEPKPLKEHGPGTNYLGIIDGHTDHKRDDEILATEEKSLRGGDQPDSGDKKDDKKDGPKKLNGTVDKLDGNWVPPSDVKKEDEEEDDNCVVKCLYYTMECCECTVM